MRIGRKKVKFTRAKASVGNKHGKETPGSPLWRSVRWAKSLGTSQAPRSPSGQPCLPNACDNQSPMTGEASLPVPTRRGCACQPCVALAGHDLQHGH